ncbi:MAG: hypothetical protein JKX71_15475 [Amylibacter sp.]|nr:hypothetical protein [Amylibacter sp.]
MEQEYMDLTQLAAEKWKLAEHVEWLKLRQAELDKQISDKSFYWEVGEDGLVDIGLGVC